MSRNVVGVADLEVGYGGRSVIRDLSISIGAGVTAVLGPNGAGKSTLLRVLATATAPWSGRLTIEGVEVTNAASLELARRNIGYLPQDFGFDPAMTVSEFVTYGAWLRGVPATERVAAVAQVLESVDLVDKSRTRMRRLSGGMVRRAGIAWALVGSPSAVYLDEPTVGLDPSQRVQFRRIIASYAQSAAVVLSTHMVDDVEMLGGRVLVLADGAVAFDGDVEALRDLGSPTDGLNSVLESAYLEVVRTRSTTR